MTRVLTPQKVEAIARREGDLMLSANAGSGKTFVLVERFVASVLEDGLRPDQVLAITFTDKAAGELRGRVRDRLLELGARDAAPSAAAGARLLAAARPYLAGWQPDADGPVEAWAGLRPATPDGLPLIGALPGFAGLYLATGHGMLGVTLAPATAAVLAPLVLRGELAPELASFDPARRL